MLEAYLLAWKSLLPGSVFPEWGLFLDPLCWKSFFLAVCEASLSLGSYFFHENLSDGSNTLLESLLTLSASLFVGMLLLRIIWNFTDFFGNLRSFYTGSFETSPFSLLCSSFALSPPSVFLPIPLSPMMHVCMLSHFSCIQFFATPPTVACQAPLSMGFSRQEY